VRSHAYWLHLLRRAAAWDAGPAPALAPGERKWLLAYAPLSWAYRLALSAALVLWLGEKSSLLGWLAAVLLAGFVVVAPVGATLRALWASLAAGAARRRAGWSIASGAAALLAALLVVPVPSTLTVRGVVWPPQHTQVRADTEGFVAEVLARDGQAVEPGSALFVLAEPGLLAEREQLRARLLGLSARQYEAILRQPAQAQNVIEEIERTSTELKRAEERVAQWTVRSRASGRLVLPHAEDLPGSFVPKGGTLAHVLVAAPAVVRAAVPQTHAERLRGRDARVEVRLAGETVPVAARLLHQVPAATRNLPSPALGERAGGDLAVDPADPNGVRALEPVLLFDVVLEERPLERLGQRAWVRFDLGAEPLASQWQRGLRQLLLKHFNPVT
jgi:putative peptide zinc metalloprotease protein